MNHEEIQSKLSEFRDGELPREEKSAILRHLAGCPECVRELNDLELGSRAFFQRPAPPTADDTEDFVFAVMSRLPAPVEVPLEVLPWAGWLAPAAGLAFAAFLFTLWLPQGEAADPLSTTVAAAEYAPDNLIAFAEER